MGIVTTTSAGATRSGMRPAHNEDTPRTRRRLELALRRGPPAITVVVIAAWESERHVESLRALGRRCSQDDMELVVVCAGPCAESAASAVVAPGRRIMAPRGASAADLRVLGMSCANGDIVAIVDDPADVDAEWLEQIRSRRQVPLVARRTDEKVAGVGN